MRSSALVDGDVEGQLLRSVTFGGLSTISLGILERLRLKCEPAQQIVMVVGPISRGVFLNRQEDIGVLNGAIDFVVGMGGVVVFDQLVFEPHFHRVVERLGRNQWSALNTAFYDPLFASCMIQRLYLLPNWETSNGAQWERNRARHYRIPVEVLSPECHSSFMTESATA